MGESRGNAAHRIPDLSSELILAEALEKYQQEETIDKKGCVQESRRIETWKKHKLSELKLSALTSAHFNEFRKERLKEGCSGNTVRLDLAVISVLFKTAKLDWGMPYLVNPIASVRKPKAGKGRDRRLDDEESIRFERELYKCRNEMVRLAVCFAVHTAAR